MEDQMTLAVLARRQLYTPALVYTTRQHVFLARHAYDVSKFLGFDR
jgi:hypothetical protein